LKSPPLQRQLLKILGVGFGLAVIVGGTLGSGILRAPGPVVAQLGDARLVMAVWCLGGVYSLFGAASLADLGTGLPKSGGFYVYARRALGDYPGFAIGWADWITNCAGIAIAAITFGDLVSLLAPGVTPYRTIVGAATIVAFAALQFTGMRVSSRVQEITSFLKGLAFVVLVAALLLIARPQSDAAAPSAPAPAFAMAGPIAMIIALQLVLQTYDGWQSALYFAGEDKDPARNLPRAFVGGELVVIAVYLFMNLALLRVLPLRTLATSTLPAADATQLLVGARGATLITALSAFSLLPLISAVMLMGPRILYAMGRDGMLPPAVGYVDRVGTPVVAMLITAGGCLALLATRTFEVMSALSAFFAVASYSGAFLSLLILRRRETDMPRPFRVWGYPWTTLAVLIASLAFLGGMVASAPRISLIALIVLAASYPVYRLTRRGSLASHRLQP
jgi:basic amino acid/polyamine antiporter, APA family